MPPHHHMHLQCTALVSHLPIAPATKPCHFNLQIAPCHHYPVTHLPCPLATKPMVTHLPCPLPPNQSLDIWSCPLPPNQSVICLAPCHQTSSVISLALYHCITALVSLFALAPCHQTSHLWLTMPPATKPVTHLTCPGGPPCHHSSDRLSSHHHITDITPHHMH